MTFNEKSNFNLPINIHNINQHIYLLHIGRLLHIACCEYMLCCSITIQITFKTYVFVP